MDHNNLCPGCFSDKGSQNPCPSCGYEEKALEASIYLPPRTTLAEKYIIGRVLGQGGFGITYLGWDLNLNMKLAIKEFFPQGMVTRLQGQSKVVSFTEAEDNNFDFWLERFLKEARTLAQFEQHPNIVSVRDFFKANNTAYMIMSYVEGITLDHYLDQAGGKLPCDKAIEVMMPVMDALREVHEVGVMHRDISPDNIFIDSKGRVVLIDFGAARQEISDKSKSLSVILKTGYAPEEQYRSRGKQGPWTDVYAVAATIYRLITGQVPPDALDRLDEDILKPPSKLGVGIAADQETHLLKGLAIKAKNRYQTIDAFQEELLGSRVKTTTTAGTERKECPYCGEEISAKAIKCKHCHSALEEEIKESEVANSEEKSPVVESPAPPVLTQAKEDKKTPVGGFPSITDQYFTETETVDLDCPVEMESYSIDADSVAEKALAKIKFRNLSDKTVNALRVSIYCFDAFGEEVKFGGETAFDKKLQDLSAKPDEIFSAAKPFELKGFADTRQIKVLIQSVLFDDLSRWDYEGNNVYEVSTEALSKQELADLRKVAGSIAKCYAKQENTFWQCVCGRANMLNAESCIRCRSNRKIIFQNALNRETVEFVLQKQSSVREKIDFHLIDETYEHNYIIDYQNGNIALGTLPIGAFVVDPTWQWAICDIKGGFCEHNIKKPVVWIIVAKNHYEEMEPHITLLSAELIGKYCFDESKKMLWPDGSNSWLKSGAGEKATRGLRPWLNSIGIHVDEGFYKAFSGSFKNSLLNTTLPNREWKEGGFYSTSDRVFIPSTTELGDTVHKNTYQIGSVYPYFQESSDVKRGAMLSGELWWYWTRSPDLNHGDSLRYVNSAGTVDSARLRFVSASSFDIVRAYLVDLGIRPVLNLKPETLVMKS